MNRDNKLGSWNDKLDLEVSFWCIKQGKLPIEQVKSNQSLAQRNPQINDLKPDYWNSFTEKTQKSFFAPATPY